MSSRRRACTDAKQISRRALVLAALPPLWPGWARAQASFPQRPITVIVPFGAGGIADITARTVAEAMAVTLKQAVIVDNRPSAGSIVGSAAVAQAAPDGHTLLLMSNANAVSASLLKKLAFDVRKDFAPISTLGHFDLGVFVASGSRFKTLPELLAQARAKPGELTLGSIAVGSTQHLATELFKQRTSIDALTVPYKGSPALLTALRAGEVDAAFEILGPMLPQIDGGAVRALAVTSAQRAAALPQVPTVQEAGVADFVVSSWNALAAPAGTPAPVIAALQQAAAAAVANPAVRDRLLGLGVRPQSSSPARMQALLTSEIQRWGEVIRRAKIPLQ
jgi:tripartite-type tricarboxylate transporter receptor subunit TctC